MTLFILACGMLLLLSSVFYLRPRHFQRAASGDSASANLAWYRLRRAELARDGDEHLTADAQLRLLEDDRQIPATVSSPAATTSRFAWWLLLPLVGVISAGLYYRMGAAPDVEIARALTALDVNASEQQIQTLIKRIETRARQRPENLNYQAILGRYYMGQQEYGRAAALYSALAVAVPNDPETLAYAAQARYLAGERILDERAQQLAEQALAIDPGQRTALGLLGMAAFEQAQYRAAIEYWQRLLASEQPGSEAAQLLAGVIERARERLAGSADEPGTVEPAGAVGVTVRVALPEGGKVNPGDTVFVLARSVDSGSRMPIAVQRLSGHQLPVTLRLDDSNSMAGQALSSAAEVVVVAQVSPSGQPGEVNASWLGRGGPLRPSASTVALEIVLAPRGG